MRYWARATDRRSRLYRLVNARTRQQKRPCQATIYHHFADKQDIASVLGARSHSYERTAEAANSPGNAIDRLRAVIRTFYDLQAERHVVFMSAIREMSHNETQLCNLLRRYRNDLLAPIGQLLDSGVRENLFRPVNDEMALVTIFGIMHSFVTHRLLIGDVKTADELVEHTLQMLLNGIGNH